VENSAEAHDGDEASETLFKRNAWATNPRVTKIRAREKRWQWFMR
jgi:hypothetical protein